MHARWVYRRLVNTALQCLSIWPCANQSGVEIAIALTGAISGNFVYYASSKYQWIMLEN